MSPEGQVTLAVGLALASEAGYAVHFVGSLSRGLTWSQAQWMWQLIDTSDPCLLNHSRFFNSICLDYRGPPSDRVHLYLCHLETIKKTLEEVIMGKDSQLLGGLSGKFIIAGYALAS